MVEEASVKISFSVALPFHHKLATIRNFLKTLPFFEVWYGAQAVGTSASHEISHMRRRYSALVAKNHALTRARLNKRLVT